MEECSTGLVETLRACARDNKLPMTPGGARFRTGVNLHRGANGQPPPLLRDWQRNMSSMSVSRHLQHLAMWRFVDTYGPRFNHRSRCLDWDGWYVGSIFATICTEKDVIQYTTSEPQEVKPKKLIWTASGANPWATRWYMADAHSMSRTLQRGAYDLIIANSVFEHFRQPFAVMQEIFVLLRPGGFLFWHTPFEYEFHGVPNDYFRFTTSGARAIAESAGLEVEFAEGDGGFVAVLSNLVGLGSHHWTLEDLTRHDNERQLTLHYLSTRMVARKPDNLIESKASAYLHPETHRDASRVASQCRSRLIVYTSVDTVGPHPQVQPPSNLAHGCAIFFVGEQVQLPVRSEWQYVVHRRRKETMQFGRRRFSKLPKLLPHLLFPGYTTIFADTKLNLHPDAPELLSHLLGENDFMAFRHPCVTDYANLGIPARPANWRGLCAKPCGARPCGVLEWMETEVNLTSVKSESATQLHAQLSRLRNGGDGVPPAANWQTYIEGALVVQRDSARIMGAWSDDFLRPTSSDRDQVSFASAIARTQQQVHLLTCGVINKTRSSRLVCPWGNFPGPIAVERSHPFRTTQSATESVGTAQRTLSERRSERSAGSLINPAPTSARRANATPSFADCLGGSFIDLGANRGDNLIRFYAGGHNASLSLLRPSMAPSSWCYYAFEANPKWTHLLQRAQKDVMSKPGFQAKVVLHVPAAVTASADVKTVSLRTSHAQDSAGTTMMPTKHISGRWSQIEVPAINLIEWWSGKLEPPLSLPQRLALKMDAARQVAYVGHTVVGSRRGCSFGH